MILVDLIILYAFRPCIPVVGKRPARTGPIPVRRGIGPVATGLSPVRAGRDPGTTCHPTLTAP